MEKSETTAEERKAKREAKRAKQRELNILRASKMHKIRIADNTLPLLSPIPRQGKKYHIGCSGWFYWDWRGIFYPEDLSTKDWFPYYADKFKTVELNAPFYSWPTITTVKNWMKQADGKDFVYTVKVCELITHIQKFTDTEELVKDFSYISTILGNRLGCFLYQLPPSYSYTPQRLSTIVSQLKNGHRNVVEFRHKSWWNEDVYHAFKEANLIFCSCSGPRLPDELIQTSDEVYIRFHGKAAWYRYDYSDDELQEWANRIKKSEAREIWIYFNNDYEGHAIKNAETLASLLHTKL